MLDGVFRGESANIVNSGVPKSMKTWPENSIWQWANADVNPHEQKMVASSKARKESTNSDKVTTQDFRG